jgi:superfamily I DNA/RNA helicase
MSDLVERLRESYSTDVFLMEVADEIERLEAEKEDFRQGYIKVGCDNSKLRAKIEQLEAVVDAAKEYEKMFARSRTKPYSVSNELQALFDALSPTQEMDDE